MNLDPLPLIALILVASLVPLFILGATSFAKIHVVIGVIKSGVGIQHAPHTLVEILLALSLSLVVMRSTLTEVVAMAQQHKLLENSSSLTAALPALAASAEPFRQFLAKHSGKKELKLVYDPEPVPEKEMQSWGPLLSAFMLTELKEAFLLAGVLLIPFLAVDLIISQLLAGMGLTMMSPMVVSLPIKLIVFVAAEGWVVVSRALITTYR